MLRLFCHVVFVCGGLASLACGAEHPNVILILADDQGWGDVQVHGNDVIHTPNMNRLCGDGISFERFFVSPVCAPTRSSLLTGRYDVRTGVSGVTGRREVMRATETTIAEVLQFAGYTTGCFGKWHNGEQFPNHPLGQGFDQFFGFCGGHWNNYFDAQLEHNRAAVQSRGYITDVLTDAAIAFIDEKHRQPFFCYVPYNAPHTPWQVPDEWFDRYSGRTPNPETQCAYAMVENIDHNIGRLLECVEAHGIADNTIVVFLTDNGPNGARYNGSMRGAKGSVHEGGVRVPCFICWPGTLQPKIVPQIAAHVDLLPTLAELCNVPLPETLPLDGRSLVPLMTSKTAEQTWPDRKLFTYRRRSSGAPYGAVRTQRYRFVREKKDQLYDLQMDPEEKSDISQVEPQIFTELKAAFDQFLADTRPSIQHVSPIPAGFVQAQSVELPAAEATLSEHVKFYNGQGWAHDWITDFDSPDDEITWNLDVQQEGSYRIELRYAAPKSDRDCAVNVSVSDQQTEAVIPDFDSSIDARPERTTPKGVRWIRTFATAQIGTLRMPQGRVKLQLKLRDAFAKGLDVDGVRLIQTP